MLQHLSQVVGCVLRVMRCELGIQTANSNAQLATQNPQPNFSTDFCCVGDALDFLDGCDAQSDF